MIFKLFVVIFLIIIIHQHDLNIWTPIVRLTQIIDDLSKNETNIFDKIYDKVRSNFIGQIRR